MRVDDALIGIDDRLHNLIEPFLGPRFRHDVSPIFASDSSQRLPQFGGRLLFWIDVSSKQDNDLSDLSTRIAGRVRQLRTERGYTLDTLAARSGVSRSAISLIERCAASPTAVVLDKLATGLDVPLASLFDAPAEHVDPNPIARRSAQPRWRDPQSGYLRRNVSPPGWPSPIRIVDVEFPAGSTVSYETADRDSTIHQQVWVLSGEIEVTVGDDTHRLGAGDCLAMRLDRLVTFRNHTARNARYGVVIVTEPVPARRAL
jgi:transcriptional regulator with XRE-family HTH domain